MSAKTPVPNYHVLTLWEPWASLVVLGFKVHETRRWKTSYRGPLIIHAGAAWRRFQKEAHARLGAELKRLYGVDLPEPACGLIVGECRLADCEPTVDTERTLFPESAAAAGEFDREAGDWSPGRYALRLADPARLLTPIPWVGSLGLRRAPEMLCRAVHQSGAVRPGLKIAKGGA